jgi:ABC-2 type transport system permease protein
MKKISKTLKIFKAFIKKDFLEEASYKFDFIMRYSNMFIHIIIVFFVSQYFGKSYFSYVLIGIAFLGLLTTGLNTFSDSIRESQMKGTLEAVLLTPTSTSLIIIASSLWRFLYMTFRIILYIFLGWLIFGAQIIASNLITGLLFMILAVLAYSSIGIISASLIMILKKGNPINTIFGTVSIIFGGIYFSPQVMPPYLKWVSNYLPIFHALNGVRGALLKNLSFMQMLNSFYFLIIFILIFAPLSICLFAYAVKTAKIHGSLTHY